MCGGGGAPPPQKPTKPKTPKCDNSSTNSRFLIANYAASSSLSQETGVPVDWILAWAAAESGSKTGAGWGQSGAATENQNYFGQKGTNWPGAIACPTPSVSGWACFANFAASATSALETVHQNWSFNGETANLTAFLILDSFNGQNPAAAFQAVGAGQDPGNSRYGSNVAAVLPGVDSRLDCLRAANLIH